MLPVVCDEYTGIQVDGESVVAARSNEVGGLRELGAWVERLVQESYDKTGKAQIVCLWVECNKGNDENPDVRSRAVVFETKRVSALRRPWKQLGCNAA